MSATKSVWKDSELKLLMDAKRENSGLQVVQLTELYNSRVTEDRKRTKGAVGTKLKKLNQSTRGINHPPTIILILTS